MLVAVNYQESQTLGAKALPQGLPVAANYHGSQALGCKDRALWDVRCRQLSSESCLEQAPGEVTRWVRGLGFLA